MTSSSAPQPAPRPHPTGNVVPIRRGVDEPGACPLGRCDGTGWLDTDEGAVTPCECRTRRRPRSRGPFGSRVPKRYIGVSFDRPPLLHMASAPESKRVVEHVKAYTSELSEQLEAGRGLWLTGDVGTGKTTLAMAVAVAAENLGLSVAVYSQAKLLRDIAATFKAERAEESTHLLISFLTSVDLLQIDDLGGAKPAVPEGADDNRSGARLDRANRARDWAADQLFEIVDERYSSRRAMVVTTNLDEAQLEEQIGARTVSRLVEICGDPLTIYGNDQRYRVGP
jgi:DNA replication protein DnaC